MRQVKGLVWVVVALCWGCSAPATPPAQVASSPEVTPEFEATSPSQQAPMPLRMSAWGATQQTASGELKGRGFVMRGLSSQLTVYAPLVTVGQGARYLFVDATRGHVATLHVTARGPDEPVDEPSLAQAQRFEPAQVTREAVAFVPTRAGGGDGEAVDGERARLVGRYGRFELEGRAGDLDALIGGLEPAPLGEHVCGPMAPCPAQYCDCEGRGGVRFEGGARCEGERCVEARGCDEACGR